MLMSVGTQGGSGYHIAWYHILGFMASTKKNAGKLKEVIVKDQVSVMKQWGRLH